MLGLVDTEQVDTLLLHADDGCVKMLVLLFGGYQSGNLSLKQISCGKCHNV
jgi:hypothetical protein